jgi:hypothetical protein
MVNARPASLDADPMTMPIDTPFPSPCAGARASAPSDPSPSRSIATAGR